MLRTLARPFALILIVSAFWRVWPNTKALFLVLFGGAFSMLLIWFPAKIDEFVFGSWHRGYRIDEHTPAFLIAGFGWFVLLSFVSLLFYSAWLAQLFGM